MPQPRKPLKTSNTEAPKPPKTDWQKRLFDRTIGDPAGWLIFSFAGYALYVFLDWLLKR